MFKFRTGFRVCSLTVCNFSCFRLKAEFQRYQSYNYNDYYQDYQNYYSQWSYDAYAEYNYSSYAPYDSMQAVGDCSLGDAVMAPALFEVKILHTCYEVFFVAISQIISGADLCELAKKKKKNPKLKTCFLLSVKVKTAGSIQRCLYLSLSLYLSLI